MKDVKKLANEISKLSTEELDELNNVLLTKYGMSSNIYRYSNGIISNSDDNTLIYNDVDTNLCDVCLESVQSCSKLHVVKTLKQLLSIGLKEAKDIVDSVPCYIVRNIDKGTALAYENELVRIGCEVKII